MNLLQSSGYGKKPVFVPQNAVGLLYGVTDTVSCAVVVLFVEVVVVVVVVVVLAVDEVTLKVVVVAETVVVDVVLALVVVVVAVEIVAVVVEIGVVVVAVVVEVVDVVRGMGVEFNAQLTLLAQSQTFNSELNKRPLGHVPTTLACSPQSTNLEQSSGYG